METLGPSRTERNRRIWLLLLQQPESVWVACSSIARSVGTACSSLSRTLWQWEARRWVETRMEMRMGVKYRHVRLTPQGRILAGVWFDQPSLGGSG